MQLTAIMVTIGLICLTSGALASVRAG